MAYYKIVGTQVSYANTKLDEGFIALTRDEEGNISNPELLPIIEAEKTKQEQAEFRAERNAKLSEVDVMINKAEDNGEDTAELRAYRQALRDATEQWVMPVLGE